MKNKPTPENTQAEKTLQIHNRYGLHPRLACDFVRCANRFQSSLRLRVDGQEFSPRSAIDLVGANLLHGSSFTVMAEGPDAELALVALDTFLHHLAVVEDQSESEHRRRALTRFDGMDD